MDWENAADGPGGTKYLPGDTALEYWVLFPDGREERFTTRVGYSIEDMITDALDPNPPALDSTFKDLAQQALAAINWQLEDSQIEAGLTAVDGLRADIATLQALPAGTLPAVIKTPLVGALTKIANIMAGTGEGTAFPEGHIHKTRKMGVWWKRLLQVFAMTDDSTLNGN